MARMLRRSNRKPGKLVFTFRYRDNGVTRFIDQVVLPLEARPRLWKNCRGYKIVRKAHGYRRSETEVLDLARRHGFELRGRYYAGMGIEFMRSALLGRIPFVMPLLRRLDRALHVACNCVIFEFLLAEGTAAAPEARRARRERTG